MVDKVHHSKIHQHAGSSNRTELCELQWQRVAGTTVAVEPLEVSMQRERVFWFGHGPSPPR